MAKASPHLVRPKNNYDVDPDPLGTVPATLLDSVIRNSGCW
jgi:hypothetical protein